MSRLLTSAILVVLTGTLTPVRGGTPEAVRARVTPALAPCVEAAAESYDTRAAVRVRVGGHGATREDDVFVGASVEVTRAIESGRGIEGTAVDVAHVPWVLVSRLQEPPLDGLEDLVAARVAVSVLGGPAGYEARRFLRDIPRERLDETQDLEALRAAAVAVLPLSLASGARHATLDVAPLLARAVVLGRGADSPAAVGFVRFLGSEDGQRAFATCAPREAR
jgi:hypothetical protein